MSNTDHHFKEGNKASPGRPKGSKNKRTQELHERAYKLGVDPFEILLLFAKGDAHRLGYNKGKDPEDPTCIQIPMKMRLDAAKEACNYLHSKKKAVEIKTDIADLPPRAFCFPDPKTVKEGEEENGSN